MITLLWKSTISSFGETFNCYLLYPSTTYFMYMTPQIFSIAYFDSYSLYLFEVIPKRFQKPRPMNSPECPITENRRRLLEECHFENAACVLHLHYFLFIFVTMQMQEDNAENVFRNGS